MTRLLAVLGPTNTGKTHFALERMLGHASGMIGFPLRLLARENYDRIVRLRGAGSVALITGEEKIIPPHPRWFVCTVESMPLDRRVSFLGVDEIQLCADPERGHIFTDRLLHARGEQETVFLGAETIKPLLRRLVPGVEFISRPRFSSLTHTGPRKLARLPPRMAFLIASSISAIVAGSRWPVVLPASPAGFRAWISGSLPPFVPSSGAASGAFAAAAWRKTIQRPSIIPTPKPAKASSAARMAVCTLMLRFRLLAAEGLQIAAGG